jgi:hypothetical protein
METLDEAIEKKDCKQRLRSRGIRRLERTGTRRHAEPRIMGRHESQLRDSITEGQGV